jgi:hypothetical protein
MRKWFERVFATRASPTSQNPREHEGARDRLNANPVSSPRDKYSADEPIQSRTEDRFKRAAFQLVAGFPGGVHIWVTRATPDDATMINNGRPFFSVVVRA